MLGWEQRKDCRIPAASTTPSVTASPPTLRALPKTSRRCSENVAAPPADASERPLPDATEWPATAEDGCTTSPKIELIAAPSIVMWTAYLAECVSMYLAPSQQALLQLIEFRSSRCAMRLREQEHQSAHSEQRAMGVSSSLETMRIWEDRSAQLQSCCCCCRLSEGTKQLSSKGRILAKIESRRWEVAVADQYTCYSIHC